MSLNNTTPKKMKNESEIQALGTTPNMSEIGHLQATISLIEISIFLSILCGIWKTQPLPPLSHLPDEHKDVESEDRKQTWFTAPHLSNHHPWQMWLT